MKKLMFVLIITFYILFAITSFASNCVDPAGKTMESTVCCGETIYLVFGSGNYSPYDPCNKTWMLIVDGNGNTYDGEYLWNNESCAVTIYCNELLGENPIWMKFIDNSVILLDTPPMSFIWSNIYTVD